jgi:hypothetical protein
MRTAFVLGAVREFFKEVGDMMEEKRYHYHIDLFCVHDGKAHFLRESRPLPKPIAEREFENTIAEYRLQVGRFRIRPASDADRETQFPGAIRVAENCKLVIVLSRCDCDSH